MFELSDMKLLTDEELFNRIMKLRRYLFQSQNHPEMMYSIEITLAVLEEEKEYRDLRKINTETEKRNKKNKNTDMYPINFGKVNSLEDDNEKPKE